jgi:hypothetical protein
MQILSGHVSPETAYLVADYPYGFRLRCSIRYWIEYRPKFGYRLISQTTNPKRFGAWNKPKASGYARFGMAMYLDENGHVQSAGLSEYSDGAQSQTFLETYRTGIPNVHVTEQWTRAKLAYDRARAGQDNAPLSVGKAEAMAAWKGE